MTRERPSRATLTKYILLQLPGLALLLVILLVLDHWLQLSSPLFWGIVLLWIAKDALLFPLVWKSYQATPTPGHHPLIGQSAETVEPLSPTGYARIAGELWACRLESGGELPPGRRVIVTGFDGLTLRVRPFHEENRPTARRD